MDQEEIIYKLQKMPQSKITIDVQFGLNIFKFKF